MYRRFALLLGLLALASPPAVSRAEIVDQGSFKLFEGSHALGAETFLIEGTLDSLVVRARQKLTVPTSQGEEPLEKDVDLLIYRPDFGMRQYQSNRVFRGRTVVRALILADTHYVAYREGEGMGEGDSRALPPGRLFVMDSQVITLFDLICRSLYHQTFDSRPINLLALGPRDTMLDARVVALGTETIRWGSRPVVARKFHLVADSRTTFTAWVGAKGELLRLVEPVSGLRAVRDPPPIRKRTVPPPSKPGG
jgi:hypothetical protein